MASRDKNVGFILRQALRSPDAQVRRLGCVGLGALGDGEVIKDLGSMLTDADPDVQLAAGLALGAIGSEAALETMLAGQTTIGGAISGEQGDAGGTTFPHQVPQREEPDGVAAYS